MSYKFKHEAEGVVVVEANTKKEIVEMKETFARALKAWEEWHILKGKGKRAIKYHFREKPKGGASYGKTGRGKKGD